MRFLPAIFILCFALSACSGEKIDSDGGDLTRSEVELLAGKLRMAVEAEYPLLKHKLVNRYVDSVGQSIVSYAPQMPPLPYEFRVLKTREILIFSLPGGTTYLSLGLLRAVELEGQLQAAIAHELAHQKLGHQLVVWRRKVNANRGQRNLLDFSGDWKDNFLGEHGLLTLDKGMEEEADRLAPVLLYRVRTDPRVYSSYLELLRRLEQSDPSNIAALLSLHPPLDQRMEWAKDGINKLPPQKDPSLSSATFQEIKAILKEAAKRGEKAEKPKGRL
jgi:predicted Zn-dependent protease